MTPEESLRYRAAAIGEQWQSPRWRGVVRPYTAEEVVRLSGPFQVEHSIATLGAEQLWALLETEPFVRTFGALTGMMAVQMVRAGLKAIYISGWQVAADANSARETYPDQSLYPADSVPNLVRRVNNAFTREAEIRHASGEAAEKFFAPIVADAEAGFGGNLNVFELMKDMVEAGAAAVHFEDQLASAKKCGHLGGKAIVPTQEFIQKLIAARLAADTLNVPTILVARTDAFHAKFVTSDVDERDRPFLTGERTPEGFFVMRGCLEAAVARALAYAPYADMIWCETATPDPEEARQFAEAVHREFPGKLLAYNCSPSFNWRKHLSNGDISRFQEELGGMGYRFQFITLAGFHLLNYWTWKLARDYNRLGMAAYVELQEAEFEAEREGNYSAVRHQEAVGTGYFDEVAKVVSGGTSSTLAMAGSTEEDQFSGARAAG